MTSSAISGQQVFKKEYGKSPARVNGLLKRLCGTETTEKFFLGWMLKFSFLVIKQILVDRQMAAWIPALSGRKCGRKSHDYSN